MQTGNAYPGISKSSKFFYITLKAGSVPDIQKMFGRLKDTQRGLLEGIVSLAYFMRGSVQYKDLLDMSPLERDIVTEFIKDRLEAESKKMHPNF